MLLGSYVVSITQQKFSSACLANEAQGVRSAILTRAHRDAFYTDLAAEGGVGGEGAGEDAEEDEGEDGDRAREIHSKTYFQ